MTKKTLRLEAIKLATEILTKCPEKLNIDKFGFHGCLEIVANNIMKYVKSGVM